MCGLAEVLLAEGATVSGCDVVESGRTERLVTLGATIHLGHDPAHLTGVDTLVVTSAVNGDSAEVAAAMDRGIPVARRSEMLGELMRCRRGIAVAGTHGKTTTTALVGHLLSHAELDPTVLVGGRARFMEAHGRRGEGSLLVCEADEFDRSFLDLNPEIAVVTNVEREHLDCYHDADELHISFALLANRSSTSGAVILSADDPGTLRLVPLLRRRLVTFGMSDQAEVRAGAVESDPNGSEFEVSIGGEKLGRVRIPLPGRHNVSNALAALAVGLQLGIPFPDLAAACALFKGVARRFELLGERDGVAVVDDYAHHPTELRAALEAARQAFPGRRVVAVFQPHLYSRTRDFAEGFGQALLAADVVVVLPVYPARERPIPGASSQLVVDEAQRAGHRDVVLASQMEEALELMDELTQQGDIVLTLGAGDVDRVGRMWLGGRR
jgi:UDP-N-acetylmuramate--alanine ligase